MATINEVRAEIHRLTDLLIRKSHEYDERERYVTEQHNKGSQNFSGDIYTVKKRDLFLQDLSGASKTIAAILTAHAAVLAAEVAWRESSISRRDAAGGGAIRHSAVTQAIPQVVSVPVERGPDGSWRLK